MNYQLLSARGRGFLFCFCFLRRCFSSGRPWPTFQRSMYFTLVFLSPVGFELLIDIYICGGWGEGSSLLSLARNSGLLTWV